MIENKKRLFKKGIILGYKRGKRNQRPSHILLKVTNTNENLKLESFLGRKIIYALKSEQKKIIWGKIVSLHGRSGVFVARFTKSLPPSCFSSRVYITPLRTRQ